MPSMSNKQSPNVLIKLLEKLYILRLSKTTFRNLESCHCCTFEKEKKHFKIFTKISQSILSNIELLYDVSADKKKNNIQKQKQNENALSKSEHGLEMLKVLNLQLLILWEIKDLLVLSFLAATPVRRGL